jgi:hypothetical protein
MYYILYHAVYTEGAIKVKVLYRLNISH